jgi:hypothetical protein
MYALMSWSQPKQREMLEAWSRATFEPVCRVQRALRTKSVPKGCATAATQETVAQKAAAQAAAPEVREMVQQQMQSLHAYGLPLYPSYSMVERRMHYPSRSWRITLPDGEQRELSL